MTLPGYELQGCPAVDRARMAAATKCYAAVGLLGGAGVARWLTGCSTWNLEDGGCLCECEGEM